MSSHFPPWEQPTCVVLFRMKLQMSFAFIHRDLLSERLVSHSHSLLFVSLAFERQQGWRSRALIASSGQGREGWLLGAWACLVELQASELIRTIPGHWILLLEGHHINMLSSPIPLKSTHFYPFSLGKENSFWAAVCYSSQVNKQRWIFAFPCNSHCRTLENTQHRHCWFG